MKTKISILLFTVLLMCIPAQEIAAEDNTPPQSQIEEWAIEIGERYNICPEFIQAVIERESRYDANAKNGSCTGLMQVSDQWHTGRMKRLGVSSLYDPYGNILVGTDYLAELFEEYGDAALVLMVYHGESDAIKKYNQGEISAYADWILTRSTELERLHGK